MMTRWETLVAWACYLSMIGFGAFLVAIYLYPHTN